MARPKKEFPPRKEKQITIRMTEDLYEVITTNAGNNMDLIARHLNQGGAMTKELPCC